jgi:anthranilate synthase component 1
MTPEQFASFVAQGFNRIPLFREVFADLDTPLSTYLKLADRPYSYLLESVQGGEKWGRYSIIGLPARTVVRIHGARIEVAENGECIEQESSADPLAWIADYQRRFRVPEVAELPRMNGGLVGYFGYDTIGYIEERLADAEKPDALETPDILLMLSDRLVVFDNLLGKLFLIVHVAANDEAYRAGTHELDMLQMQLRAAAPYPVVRVPREIAEQDFVSGFTEAGYKDAVAKARQYIIDGDVMQVVLSQRLSIPFAARPLDLYRALRCLNPSPYMYFLDLEDFHIVGSSPEILVRLQDDTVTVRPIAGTRPRGADEAEDKLLEDELLADPKERAEHLMLIDLGRNDAGRVSRIGSVHVTEQMLIERYSHVMHIVSNVEGELREGLDGIDWNR